MNMEENSNSTVRPKQPKSSQITPQPSLYGLALHLQLWSQIHPTSAIEQGVRLKYEAREQHQCSSMFHQFHKERQNFQNILWRAKEAFWACNSPPYIRLSQALEPPTLYVCYKNTYICKHADFECFPCGDYRFTHCCILYTPTVLLSMSPINFLKLCIHFDPARLSRLPQSQHNQYMLGLFLKQVNLHGNFGPPKNKSFCAGNVTTFQNTSHP